MSLNSFESYQLSMLLYMFEYMYFQMKKLQPVARLMITSAALRTLQHVHLKKNAKEDVEE